MKKILFLVALSLIAMTYSCDKEENNDCSPSQSHALDGEWHLINVSCECEPVILELGENVWTMNVAVGTLVVEDNTTEDYPAVPASGNYDLIVTTDSLYYEWPYGYTYHFQNGDLFLDQQSESDGPLVQLTRP